MKHLVFPLCFLAVSLACKRPEPEIRIQRVEIPVAVPCPEPPKPSRPVSLTAALPKDASPDQRAKALVADLAAWIGYALEEEQLLDAYRPKPKEPR